MADLNNLLGNLGDDGEENTSNSIDDGRRRRKDYFNWDIEKGREGDDDREDDGKNYHADNDEMEHQQHQFYPDEIVATGVALTPYRQLTIAWKQELACPELLPYHQELMEYFIDLLVGQEDVIDKTKEQDNTNNQMVASLSVDILKIELDRVRFILADLVRTRIHKIEKYALYSRIVLDRMSDKEVQYLQEYGKLLESHLTRTVLNHIPRSFARLDMPEMIDKPNFDETVFCQMLEPIELRETTTATTGNDEQQDASDLSQEITTPETGTTYIARYSAIRDFVLHGKVVLLS